MCRTRSTSGHLGDAAGGASPASRQLNMKPSTTLHNTATNPVVHTKPGVHETRDDSESLIKMREIALRDGRKGYPPAKIGEAVLQALTAKHPKARYEVRPDRAIGLTTAILPARITDKIVARTLNIKRSR